MSVQLATLPLEGIRNEIKEAVEESIDRNHSCLGDVTIRTNPAGRPVSVSFVVNTDGSETMYTGEEKQLRRLVQKDTLGKNGLLLTKCRYDVRQEYYECRLGDVWFTSKRPGSGIPMWYENGEVGDQRHPPRELMTGPTHYVNEWALESKYGPMYDWMGLDHCWAVFRNSDKRLARVARRDPSVYDASTSASLLRGRVPGRNSLMFERLSEAQAMLARITMEGEKITKRLVYGQRDPNVFGY